MGMRQAVSIPGPHSGSGPHPRDSLETLSALDIARMRLMEAAMQVECVAFDVARQVDAAQVGKLIELAAILQRIRLHQATGEQAANPR